MNKTIKGFSKLSKEQKIEWVTQNFAQHPKEALELLKSYWHNELSTQKLHDDFIENAITNYYLPFAVAPNFRINNKMYCIPLAIEESSVVAAAAKAANYWNVRGGFKTKVISTTKVGQVHFIWEGIDKNKFHSFFEKLIPEFHRRTELITKNMRQRGGGILNIELRDKTDLIPNYFQIHALFDTKDSMGANFINSVLEEFAKTLIDNLAEQTWETNEKQVQIVMSILSNYTPECLVRAEVSCPVKDLNEDNLSPDEFAQKFQRAVRIAEVEPHRAVTHNKGIMNGIDSVVIATGNDFRAIEACAHAYASRNGKYSSLTHCEVSDGIFTFYIEIPLALGTVGGITSLHPMVKFANEILGNPNAEELMQITAVTGLAQNFSALRSLTTTGIQKGHMKMHLLNILNQLGANEEEKADIVNYFKDKIVSYQSAVEAYNKIKRK
ncbi:MAG: hydroxymethylglutaryl-CoA reductase, degradative [Bacteroidetes bacterium]|nr:hydroxymethylglutaryl-CoA reductase, degradative [Bacteroidota bacterium]